MTSYSIPSSGSPKFSNAESSRPDIPNAKIFETLTIGFNASHRPAKKQKIMAASPKPAKPKSTNPKATTIPTITHPDATLEDPISLQWPKRKSPLEKPDHCSRQGGEQYAGIFKGAALACAEQAATPYDENSHNPTFFENTKPLNPTGKPGKPFNVHPAIFRA
ncbi:hypothetical protein N7494_007234 [Penicillium frequentans]|uniref:Uncharacterized protein n=1 Tax=Penicillium frequentans TaxID=3151616 RepID=A0AAD6CS51_9EURO|nr:hypothetical protein N7494_007234 [Penicillium glabrum]